MAFGHEIGFPPKTKRIARIRCSKFPELDRPRQNFDRPFELLSSNCFGPGAKIAYVRRVRVRRRKEKDRGRDDCKPMPRQDHYRIRFQLTLYHLPRFARMLCIAKLNAIPPPALRHGIELMTKFKE